MRAEYSYCRDYLIKNGKPWFPVIGGRISTGSYKDKDGKTIYTTDVVVEEHEFAQNKDSGAEANLSRTEKTDKDGFMEVPDGELPFD